MPDHRTGPARPPWWQAAIVATGLALLIATVVILLIDVMHAPPPLG